MPVHDVLNQFARTLGLGAIEPDEEPHILEFDGNPVSLSYRDEQERLLLYSDVGFLARPTPELLLGLLEANALHHAVGDGNIGLVAAAERDGFVVVYSQLLRTATLDVITLTEVMHKFVALLEAWQHSLAAAVKSSADIAAGNPAEHDGLRRV